MAVYEVNVQKAFTADHSLPLPDGTAEAPHSHEWLVTATFRSGRLDETMGVVIDFLAVKAALADICDPLDGADLNAQPAFADGRASAERVARFIAEQLTAVLADQLSAPGGPGPWLRCVGVTEAPGCSATFYADGCAT